MILLEQPENVLFSSAHDVSMICRDLFKKTGITYFGYTRYYDDGHALILSTCPEFKKCCLDNRLFATRSEFHARKESNSRFFFISEDWPTPVGIAEKNPGKYLANIINAMQFDVYNRVYRITYHPGYVKSCSFAIDHNSKTIFETYMSFTDTLEKFISEFESKVQKIINQKNDKPIIFPGYCDLDTESKTTTALQLTRSASWLNTLSTDLLFDTNSQLIHFTHRELECLLLNVLGNTAKEIAYSINISYRTVQTHLFNAKEKMGPVSKQKLRKALLENSYCKVFFICANGGADAAHYYKSFNSR